MRQWFENAWVNDESFVDEELRDWVEVDQNEAQREAEMRALRVKREAEMQARREQEERDRRLAERIQREIITKERETIKKQREDAKKKFDETTERLASEYEAETRRNPSGARQASTAERNLVMHTL